jgi:hypothetical protein
VLISRLFCGTGILGTREISQKKSETFTSRFSIGIIIEVLETSFSIKLYLSDLSDYFQVHEMRANGLEKGGDFVVLYVEIFTCFLHYFVNFWVMDVTDFRK